MVWRDRPPETLSWHQERAERSLTLITERVAADAAIIDVGGGDSPLAGELIRHGYRDVTVLDISEAALTQGQRRLGPLAEQVSWIAADVTTYRPTRRYQLWHDRAVFHFLTAPSDQQCYAHTAAAAVAPSGWLIVAGFAPTAPSGAAVRAATVPSSTVTQLKPWEDPRRRSRPRRGPPHRRRPQALRGEGRRCAVRPRRPAPLSRSSPVEAKNMGVARARRTSPRSSPSVSPLSSPPQISQQESRALRDRLERRLHASLPGQVTLNGSRSRRLPNTLNVSIEGVHGHELLAATPGIAASLGSACHSGARTASPVLTEMGYDVDQALSAIRLSVGRWTTTVEVDTAAQLLADAASDITSAA